jgi:hypothetical protein
MTGKDLINEVNGLVRNISTQGAIAGFGMFLALKEGVKLEAKMIGYSITSIMLILFIWNFMYSYKQINEHSKGIVKLSFGRRILAALGYLVIFIVGPLISMVIFSIGMIQSGLAK